MFFEVLKVAEAATQKKKKIENAEDLIIIVYMSTLLVLPILDLPTFLNSGQKLSQK